MGTLITAITIPISLVGTFFFLSLVGVSMNVLSMFSLVLSIGIVVDNAIVVMEAIHEKMTKHLMPPKEAVSAAMKEISGAIISITIVIAAVFLPIGFMEGPVGIFYKEFAYTIIFAVLISAVNALTLGPVLTRIFFKDRGDKVRKTPGFVSKITQNNWMQKIKRSRERGLEKFDELFERSTKKHTSIVKWSIHNKWLSLLGLVLIFVATGYLMSSTPNGFIPTEDDNFLIMSLRMPE